MRILMLVNWKVEYCDSIPEDKQPPDYYVKGQPYWFFRYFKEPVEIDVVDIHTFPWLENFEKEKIRFYIIQTLKVLPGIRKYDIILSHGMQSGVVLSLIRRFIPMKAKHIVFDIGAFNSASESGMALKLMQFASKSIDGIIYHTSAQNGYYRKFFPWILTKSKFIRFGTDTDFFRPRGMKVYPYILCAGYAKRDWETLYAAFVRLQSEKENRVMLESENKEVRLKLIGYSDFHPENEAVESVSFIPVKELMREIEGALFCVLPLESFLYSFGQMTLLQQMALGKAVITARVPSMVDYVTDRKDALLYEAGDSEDLYKKMKVLLENDRFRSEMGDNAVASVRKEWNEKLMAQEIEKYIREVLEEKA